MSQLFQVLRCYKCLAFQVHHTKKSNKFLCKICNEKQSIKRHYSIGIAKDCRMHVQKLNKLRGEKDETILEESSEECRDVDTSENSCENISYNTDISKNRSKWLAYVDIDKSDTVENQSHQKDSENEKYNSR
ncbi:hypothetical protein KGM_204259 [Danaus plexippus plexippus]|uniref:MRN complex-interacting protein N-terminal domain-containing protein n=2 Tax=Danaus plexippus TaxID=13037 RepID=A0A212EXR2_DANPL|nr:hypothetical protein KGM_204259 [Danaus plexippus plexippus]